ncbi:MAG: serine/threonine protein kinase, partial [Deltaproteobacteria bacterium]
MKESWVGKTLWNRFEIRVFLGEGGMGRVYRAWDEKLQRDVAIKMLKMEVGAQQRLERFQREAKTLARYTADPNILTLFDFQEDRERNLLAIIMEFVDGVSLRDLLASGLEAEPLLQIVRQICHALARPHADGVIHRDIKPENVMVTEEGRVVLMDFGLAKCLSGEERLTRPDHLVGTLAYMSPEQFDSSELSPASDVFAIGICLYEGLVGKHPFYTPGGPRDTLIANIVNGRYEIPEGTIPDPALVSIVRGMLEKDPCKRFADARALGDALDRFFARVGLVRERSAIESALSASVGPLVRKQLSDRNEDFVPFDTLAETLYSNGDESEDDRSFSLLTATLDSHGGERVSSGALAKGISSDGGGGSWNSRPTADISHPSVGRPVVGKLLPWILSGGVLLLAAFLFLASGLREGEDPGLAVAKRFSAARPLPAGKAGPGKGSPLHLPRYRREGPAKLSAKTSEEAMLGITIWRLRPVAESDFSVAPELRLLSYDPDLGKEIEWVLERVPLGSRFSPGERI